MIPELHTIELTFGLGDLVISEYKVLRDCCGGYYVGRTVCDPDFGEESSIPFDRKTRVFDHRYEAQDYLDHMNYSWNDGFEEWPCEEDYQLDIAI